MSGFRDLRSYDRNRRGLDLSRMTQSRHVATRHASIGIEGRVLGSQGSEYLERKEADWYVWRRLIGPTRTELREEK